MMALSVRQPFASLIMAGLKEYETRGWKGPPKYRGPLAIHASKGYGSEDRYVAEQLRKWSELRLVLDGDLPLGAMLGVCELVAIHRATDVMDYISDLERAVGFYAAGRQAWKLRVVEVYPEPIPVLKGALGIWEWIP